MLTILIAGITVWAYEEVDSKEDTTVYKEVSVEKPAILLADEPTGALDRSSGAEVLKLFQRLHEMGNTIVMITHDLSVAEHAQRVVKIVDGVLSES